MQTKLAILKCQNFKDFDGSKDILFLTGGAEAEFLVKAKPHDPKINTKAKTYSRFKDIV